MKVCPKCGARFTDDTPVPVDGTCPHDQAQLVEVPDEVEVIVSGKFHVRLPGGRLSDVLARANRLAKAAVDHAISTDRWPELEGFEVDYDQGPDNLPGTDVDELEVRFLEADFAEDLKQEFEQFPGEPDV